jgi:hypothetical protein
MIYDHLVPFHRIEELEVPARRYGEQGVSEWVIVRGPRGVESLTVHQKAAVAISTSTISTSMAKRTCSR